MSVGTLAEWEDVARQQQRGVTAADEGGCLATFYHRPVFNARKSDDEGRPVYDSVPYVKIIVPGDNKSIVDRKIQPNDKVRWPSAWERFSRSEEGVMEGTPVEEWPFLNTTRVAELKHIGMRTVEQVAHLSDEMLSQIGPGGRELRDRAQQFLKPQSETETELRTAVSDLERMVKSLTARLDEANRQIEELTAPDEPKRRGRPRKQ